MNRRCIISYITIGIKLQCHEIESLPISCPNPVKHLLTTVLDL